MSSILDAALKYREMGYTPIPLNGKAPKFDGWQKERNVTEEQVHKWFVNGANVGIVCGEASKNLVVIDFDHLPYYVQFCERFPDLAETYTVLTGSGVGMHVYLFADTLPQTTEAKGIDGDSKKNIELKTNGRQVVAPPSIHPETGKAYEVHKRVPIKRVSELSEVVDWVRSYQSNESWQPPPHVTFNNDKELNPAVLDALRSIFESKKHKLHKDWINCPCPNHLAHSHGDQHPTFGYNTQSGWGHCFRCGTISTKALCEYVGIDPKTLGGLFKNNPAPMSRNPERVNLDLPPEGSPLSDYGASRADGLATYNRRLLSSIPPDQPPLIGPLTALYSLGGYCRVLPMGHLVFIVGSSGTGKTSMLETVADKWTVEGYNLIIWSPEWTPEEMVERAVQRQGGASLEQLYLHQIALADKQNGYSRTRGELMSDEIRSVSMDKAEDLAVSMGEIFYLGAKELTSLDFKTILPDVKATLYREQKRRYQAVLIDYAQLMHACENKDVSMYQVLMRIKQACLACSMVGVIATQTTKADTRAKDRGNQLLDSSSARFVNEDAANLFITLNLEETPPGGGAAYSTGILNVTKNSIGKKGKVRVFTDLERLSWLDKKHINQDMSQYEED